MPDETTTAAAGSDLTVFNVRTVREDRPVAGAESLIATMPASLYVAIGGEPPALDVRSLGRLLRHLSEAGAHLVEEELHHADWVITTDPAVVEERGMHGQPGCATCREGTDAALKILTDQPGQELLVGVLYYARPAT